MKNMILVFSVLLATKAFATNEEIKVNCDQGAQGKVSIEVKDSRLSNEKALELAYACLLEKNTQVRNSKAAAIRAARVTGADVGSRKQCAKSNEDLQILKLTSWDGGRPGYTSEEGVVEIGRSGTYLVRKPFSCGAIGTGLFEGIVSASTMKMSIEENYRFNMEDDSKPSIQRIEIALQQIFSL